MSALNENKDIAISGKQKDSAQKEMLAVSGTTIMTVERTQSSRRPSKGCGPRCSGPSGRR